MGATEYSEHETSHRDDAKEKIRRVRQKRALPSRAVTLVTTLAMGRAEKSMVNSMVDVVSRNAKLRRVRESTDLDAVAARAALARNGWNVKAACRQSGQPRFSSNP